MKYNYTLIALIISFFTYAQVPRQKVILEVGTGTWCSSCPAVVDIIHDLEEEGANIAVVEYHKGDSYQNSDALLRKSYYNFPWYPTTYYDSNHIGYDDWATYSVHHNYYETQNELLSSFTLSIDGEVDGTNISGTVSAEKVAEYGGENLVLHVVLTESNISENWQGETELDYVERKMFPNGNGTAISFSDATTVNLDFNFTLDDSWESENCKIVYFIQNNDSKQILQGDEITLNTLSSLEYSQAALINIYPNPVENTINLQIDNNLVISNIEITDIKGSVVQELQAYNEQIDVSALPSGVYFLSYLENQTYKRTKFIKE